MHRNNFKHFSYKGKYLPYIIVRLAWGTKQLIEEDWKPGNNFKSPCISVKDIFNREGEKKKQEPLTWAPHKTEYLGSEPFQNLLHKTQNDPFHRGKKVNRGYKELLITLVNFSVEMIPAALE